MTSAEQYDPLGAFALSLLLPFMTVASLRTAVSDANSAYRRGEPIMSDTAYDELVSQLREVAPHAPELDSDAVALLSLDRQELEDWYSSLPSRSTLVVQPKIDGCSLALRYTDGQLSAAWTRSGRCAMAAAMLVQSIPRSIMASGVVEIHGELYGADFAGSQKVAAKSLNTRPSGDGLLFCAYRLVGSTGTECSTMIQLRKLRFDVPDTLVCTEPGQVRSLHQKWINWELFDSWPTDGIVVKVSDHALQQELGHNTQVPHWALAMKRYG